MAYIIREKTTGCYASVSFCPMIAKRVKSIKKASQFPEKGMAETIALELCDCEVVETKD